MNQPKLWLLTFIILAIALSGCNIIGGEIEEEAETRLDINEWPTPVPTEAPPTPTPFIKVTPKVTPPPTVAAEAEVEATTPPAVAESDNAVSDSTGDQAAAGLGDVDLGNVDLLNLDLSDVGGNQALFDRANSLINERLPAVGVGVIRVDDAALRNGPSDSYGRGSGLARGELVGVSGKNSAGDWVYVFGTSQRRGWLPLTSIRFVGNLDKAPVVPPDPLAAIAAELGLAPVSAGAAQTTGDTGQPTSPAPPAATLDDLDSVAQASINVSSVNVRQGPGPDYGRLGAITGDAPVEILAVNQQQDWALVTTPDLEAGWVYLNTLTLDGDLSEAPTVYSARPDTNIPSGQIAPISRIVGGDGATVAANTSAASSQPIPATGVSDTPPGFGGLAPLTSGQLTKPEVSLRWGPGEEYGEIDELTSDDTKVDILAQNESGQWVFVRVQRFEQDLGWLAVEDLEITGDFSDAPQIITARVKSNEVEVWRGPNIDQDKIGQLGINTIVTVLGLDDRRSWALIQLTSGEGLGWLPLRFLEVSYPLRDLPPAPDIPVRQETVVEAPAPPPIPPRPVEESQLVLQLSSGGEIVVINPDGTGLRSLTSGIDPALSPDGQTVAFTRWEEGEAGRGTLWTIGSDGGNEQAVLGFIDKQPKGPEWSPDGSQIVINFQQGGRLEERRLCTDLTQSDPASPPGNATDIDVGLDNKGEPELCWTVPPDPFWDLRVVDVADGDFQDLDGGTYAFRPTWDPSQPWRIISDGGRGLLAVSVEGDYQQEISDIVGDSSPVFSPDGRFIALTAGRQGGDSGYDIYRLNRDGGGRVRLTETPLWVPLEPDSNGKQWNNVAPAWSPDSSQIAFLTDRTGRWEIWLMNADGSNPRPMFSDAVNAQLPLEYNFVDERVISWR